MAQHISILNTEHKGFQKVAKNFQKRATGRLWSISGSLLFKELLYEDYKLNPNDKVFITSRSVNGKKELFELHYDTKANKLIEIFLVS